MLSALLLVALSQSPSPAAPNGVVVLVSQRTGGTPEHAQQLANDVSDALAKNGVPIRRAPDAALAEIEPLMKDATACDGKRACLAKLGSVLGASGVVVLEVAEVMKETALHLELIATADGTRLAEHSLVLSAKDKTPIAAQLKAFSAGVLASLPPPPPVEVAKEPSMTKPAPDAVASAKPAEPSVVYVEKRPSALKTWAWAPLAVGAAGVAAGGAFLGAAADRYHTLTTDSLPIDEADRVRNEGKRYQTYGAIGLGVGIAAAAGGVAMLLLGGDETSQQPAIAPTASANGAGVMVVGTFR